MLGLPISAEESTFLTLCLVAAGLFVVILFLVSLRDDGKN